MSLEKYLRNVQPHEATVPEIQALLQVVDRELSDAQARGLSPDGRFQHAYEASLQLCAIALIAAGYVVSKGGWKHKVTIESLRYTLGDRWGETADYVERCSRLRGQAVYERVGVVSEQDATELLETAKTMRNDVIEWLKGNYPELVPPNM